MKKEITPIDFNFILRAIIKNKKAFFYTMPIVFIVSSLIIISIPRSYTCEVKLAPESTSSGIGSIGALASSFGVNLANKLDNEDAISPELYPDLMNSIDFKVSLFPIKIQTKDKKIETTYYNYLEKHQKYAWWLIPINYIKKLFEKKEDKPFDSSKKIDPFILTKKQKDITSLIEQKIDCEVDKKTNVISIVVTDQDPLVCATMADSIKSRLQLFITDYRTNKAKIDLEYTKKLYVEAKSSYDKARQLYATFSDGNQELILESYKAKQEDLENEMQLKYNNYNSICQQLLAAKAKVQERTPAFTTLQSASVPNKPSKPKRMLFVLAMLFLTFIITSIYSINKMQKQE